MAGRIARALLVFGLALSPTTQPAATAAPLPPDMVPTGFITWHADDGWTGSVRHYPGPGEPVLLVHGMGANHYNFDYRRELSLAAWLQDQGWDVWVPDLRGDPGTKAPDARAARDYDFDDHARHDLPAIVDAVLEATGRDELSWVGHSMGGMLLYTALSHWPEKVRAGVAIASPARFEQQNGWHRLARMGRPLVGGRGMLPVESGASAARVLGRQSPVDRMLTMPGNIERDAMRALRANALQDLPRAMGRQVVSWLRSGELVQRDGVTPWLQDQAHDVPLLVLAADQDKVAHPDDVLAACEVFAPCESRLLGESSGLPAQGHIDPVFGRQARGQVYPLVDSWLRSAGRDVSARH